MYNATQQCYSCAKERRAVNYIHDHMQTEQRSGWLAPRIPSKQKFKKQLKRELNAPKFPSTNRQENRQTGLKDRVLTTLYKNNKTAIQRFFKGP